MQHWPAFHKFPDEWRLDYRQVAPEKLWEPL